MKLPKPKKIHHSFEHHGIKRDDPFFWLNDRDNPAVIRYLKQENRYLNHQLKHTTPLQKVLYKEITSRIKKTDNSVPHKKNGYYYYTRYKARLEYPIYCRKKDSLKSQEEILIDVNTLAQGKPFCHVGNLVISPDNNLLIYALDTVGRRQYELFILDLCSGLHIGKPIPNTSGAAAWASDSHTFFYVLKDHALRPFKVMRQTLDFQSNVSIYEEKDEKFTVHVYSSKSRKFIYISSSSTLSDECRFVSADTPYAPFKVFQDRQEKLEYSISHHNDYFYINTNHNATNFCIKRTPINKTSLNNWETVIDHRDNVLVENFELFDEFIVINERINGLLNLRVINWKNKTDYYIHFDEDCYESWISTNMEFESNILRFGYSSLTTPSSLFDYNMYTNEKKLLKEQPVLGKFDKNDYQAERLFATASDGTQVPISLVYRKGLKKNGQNPLLLYGYGSYGHSIDPTFSSARLSLLDRGYVFAIAHIRGGEDMGRSWYENGKLFHKKNTFTDFICCADYLIKTNFTCPDKCAAVGGSAGGLLVGAVMNMRPDLFKAVVAHVPFVDVVTTMLDDSIPLTVGEYDEWGNPNEKEYFDYILSYSPYDNVTAQYYPALLVTSGLHDSQVQYWEPTKWVAKLRDLKKDTNPIYLKTNLDAGHGGKSGRFRRYKETALEYAFLIDLML